MQQLAAAPSAIPAAGWVRIAVKVLAMLLLLLVCVPLYYTWRIAGRRNPWPRAFLAGVGRIAGMEIRASGERVACGEFLLANHISWLDVPALAGATGAAFVAQDGLASIGLLRWLCAMNDTVFVARHDRAGVKDQVARVRAAIRDTGALAIFPEGTTSDGSGLLPFKSSLLSALNPVPDGVAVQPVMLDYGDAGAEIAWIGEEPGLANFLRILARAGRIKLVVRFLEPLAGQSLANRKTMAAAARAAILTASQERCG